MSTKPFASKIKVSYNSSLGMWCTEGESITRSDVNSKSFYDKKNAIEFKKSVDERDLNFYYISKMPMHTRKNDEIKKLINLI